MAFDAKKNILLEKQYFYVKAQKGFKLQGTSTEIIPTNTGFYRFLVANLTFALGNSYIDVIYDSTDMTFQAYCSDLFMENVQNTVTVAVENMNVDLAHFAEQNHSDITLFATQVGEDMGTLGNGISAGLKQVDDDVNANAAVAHEDAQAIKDAVDNIDLSPVTAFKDANHADIEGLGSTVGTALGAVDSDIKSASEQAHNDSSAFKDANHADLEGIKAKIPSVSGLALDVSLQFILAKLGDWLKQATFEDFATVLSTALQLLHTDNEIIKTSVDALGKDSSLKALDESVKAVPSSLAKDATVSEFATGVGGALEAINTILTAISMSNEQIPSFKSANHSDLASILAKIPSVSGLALDATLSALATALGTALQAVNTNLEAVNTGTVEISNFKAQNHEDVIGVKNSVGSVFDELDLIYQVLGDWVKPSLFSSFKDANHVDLTALLTAFNSLAEELKKKLAFSTSRILTPSAIGIHTNMIFVNLDDIPVGGIYLLNIAPNTSCVFSLDTTVVKFYACLISTVSDFLSGATVYDISSLTENSSSARQIWYPAGRLVDHGKVTIRASSSRVYCLIYRLS